MIKRRRSNSVYVNGYSYDSTILLLGFDVAKQMLFESCIDGIIVEDRVRKCQCGIKLYITDNITDFFAIPHFMSVVNFQEISAADRISMFEFLREVEEPVTAELEGYFDEDIGNYRLYGVNFYDDIDKYTMPTCFKIDNDFFKSKGKIRLAVLIEVNEKD